MNKKIARSLSVGLLFVMLLTMPGMAASAKPVSPVNDIAMSLRTSSSTSLISDMLIPCGFLFVDDITSANFDFLNLTESVNLEEGEGEQIDKFKDLSSIIRINGENINISSSASADSNPLPKSYAGATLTVIGISGTWLKVETVDGKIGYISSDYVEANRLTFAITPETKGEKIVRSAKEFLGTPYVWGGMSPSGFDCSGFVNYVYGLYGYSMNRVAQNIFTYDGIYIEKGDLQAGDLMFFGNGAYSVNHTAIYIGDDMFIHSSSSDVGVVISDLSSDYYTQKYVGAKRILEDNILQTN